MNKPVIEKKRGRPPKTATQYKEPITTTIKNTENDFKKYSLISNNIINTTINTNTKNIIVHLKITKEKLIELEAIITNNLSNSLYDKNSYDLLDNLKFEKFEKIDDNNEEKKKSDEPINQKDKIINIKKIDIKKKAEEQQKRRNLIINSGIKYKIDKIMLNFNYNEANNNGDLWCWNCCHPFIGTPVGIPEKISYNNNKFIFELSGVFCSYNCAYRNLRPTMVDDISNINTNCDIFYSDDKADKIQMLEMLCHIEMKTPLNSKIKAASSRSALKVFGGKLTIEEYRANFLQNSAYHIYKYPMISINYNLEETTTKINNNSISYENIEANYDYYCKLLKLSNN